MSTKKAIIIILLAIAASVLIMESAVYSVTSDGSGGSGLSVSYKDTDLESLKGYSYTETRSGYTVFMEQGSGELQTVDIVLDVQSMSIEGSYWMPLCKRLSYRYSGSAVSTDNLIDISFNGHSEGLSIVGLCSPFAAKRIARQEAMDEIERDLEQHFDTVTHQVQRQSQANATVVSR